jgi:hypothetical protein
MSDLLKYLIEKAKTHPWSAEALLLASLLGAFFLAVSYVQARPEVSVLFHNRYFQAGAVLILTVWLVSLPWRYGAKKALPSTVSLMGGLLALVLAVGILQAGKIEPFRVRVMFDESISVTPVALNEFVTLLRTPLLDLEVSDEVLVVTNSTRLRTDEVWSALSQGAPRRFETGTSPPLPVLVTGKYLVSEKEAGLLSMTRHDAVVISTWGVVTEASLADSVVAKYVATTTLLEALRAQAMERDISILEKRSKNIYRGCLYDYHRTRQTYILQSQKPELCPAEAVNIKSIFGDATLAALKEALSRIGAR